MSRKGGGRCCWALNYSNNRDSNRIIMSQTTPVAKCGKVTDIGVVYICEERIDCRISAMPGKHYCYAKCNSDFRCPDRNPGINIYPFSKPCKRKEESKEWIRYAIGHWSVVDLITSFDQTRLRNIIMFARSYDTDTLLCVRKVAGTFHCQC